MDSPRTFPKGAKRHFTAYYSSRSLFDSVIKQEFEELALAACNPDVSAVIQGEHDDSLTTGPDAIAEAQSRLVVADCMSCNSCQTEFANREEQLGHYKCDWHRYNLHRRLRGMPSVTEEEFERIAGDVSSISGSDDEEEEDGNLVNGLSPRPEIELCGPEVTRDDQRKPVMTERKFHKVFFKNKTGELLSVYRCLLHDKKNPLHNPEDIVSALSKLPEKAKWIVMMVSSGHFAGAVFEKNEVVDHKTFHRYTIRAKRGTAQSSKDGQGNAPKSAGASLRRYNEAALAQDIQDLLATWAEHLKSCDLVFVRIPVANRGIFYGGRNPALRKDDPRIRVIPFATRRPTFSETKRIQQMFASVECYGPEADVGDVIPLSPPRKYVEETGQLEVRDTLRTPKTSKAKNKKQGTPDVRGASDSNWEGNVKDPPLTEAKAEEVDSDEGVEMELVETMEEITFTDLKEFDHSPKKKQNKKKKPPLAKRQISPQFGPDEETIRWRNSLFTSCKTGNVETLMTILSDIRKQTETSDHKEVGSVDKNEIDSSSLKSLLNSGCEAAGSSISSAVSNIGESKIVVESQNVGQTPINLSSDNCNKTPSVDSDTDVGKENTGGSLSQKDLLKKDGDLVTEEMIGEVDGVSSVVDSDIPATTSETGQQPNSLDIVILNTPVGDSETSFLHIAAKEGHPDMVTALLEAGADPARKDKSGKTPYNYGGTEVRNAFRRFMATNPHRYDYFKAQVPSPLTDEMEAEKKQKVAEKRKARKKAYQEKNKEKKATEAKEREETKEKERFLALSEREKRALAAERRLLQQCSGAEKPVLSRCWECGTDITGKIPFEYADYKFCTTKCLREHRSKAAR